MDIRIERVGSGDRLFLHNGMWGPATSVLHAFGRAPVNVHAKTTLTEPALKSGVRNYREHEWPGRLRNSSIGRITTAGVVSNFAGHGIARPFGIAARPDGALWFSGTNRIGRITPGGAISIFYTQSSAYPLGGSGGVARGSDGAMWFANGNEDSIGWITTSVTPEITSFAPHSRGPGIRVTIWGHSITRAIRAAFNGVTARIIARRHNRIIVRVPDGDTAGPITVTTWAGTATSTALFH